MLMQMAQRVNAAAGVQPPASTVQSGMFSFSQPTATANKSMFGTTQPNFSFGATAPPGGGSSLFGGTAPKQTFNASFGNTSAGTLFGSSNK
jgi:hypothetical protein